MAKKGTPRKSKAAKKTPSTPAKKAGSSLKPWQKEALTHTGIILAFLLLVVMFFSPVVFQNKVMRQGDIQQFTGMAKELRDYRQEKGEEALWSTRIFSGMPGYQISVEYPGNLFKPITKLLRFGLPNPAFFVFMTFLGFYLFLNILKINPYLSGLGAVAFALSSYFFIILEAGHTSKAHAIAYMAPIVGGIILTYRGKWLLGGAITAFFLALEITANHLQITYYLAIMIGFLGIAYFVDAIMKKTLPDFFKASGVLIIAALLGVAPSTSLLWTTSQYAAETMRGQSELPAKDGEVSSGLNLDYALRWSYGVEESFTLLVPNFYGGSTSFLVKDRELERQFGQKNLRLRTYWGDQPSTSGPVYVGAIICFLFVLGLLITRGPIKWAMLATFLIFLMLSWGKNFLPLTELFFNIFPGYNKFRAVSMTLVMVEFAMPLLGILALNKVIQTEKKDRKNLTRPLLIAGGITGGLSLIFALLGGVLFDFSGAVDSQMNASVVDILVNLRSDMLLSDSLRSFALIAVAFGLIWFYLRDAIKPSLLYAGLTALVVIDMLPVNARFLNEDNYVNERTLKNEYTPSQADQFIMQDPDPDFRVVNLPGSPNQIIQVVNEARTSYYHRNIGGYHAAKLGRYNDLIDTVLIQDIYQLYQVLGEQNDSIRQLRMSNLDVLNMLNLRYVIYPTQQAGPQAFQYTGAHGSAWFVNRIQQVQTPQEEILALRSINTGNTAVVDVAIDGGRFGEQIKGLGNQSDPNARITLTSFDNKRITYKSNSSQPQLAVFSEIYYNDKKGWKAYLDGQEVPHLRANYVLRALNVPAGEHEIEFRFEPAAYFTGETISLISSIILLLLMAGVAFLEWRRRNQENSLEESNNQAT